MRNFEKELKEVKGDNYINSIDHSGRDTLTGLYTNKQFISDFEKMIKDSEINRTSGSVVLLDFDFFGRFNREFGMSAGDAMLVKLSDFLTISLPQDVNIYRYLSDIFAVLIPGVDKNSSYKLFTELRQKFNPNGKLETRVGTIQSHMTFSAGIAAVPDDGVKSAVILEKIREAVIKIKNNNKGGVCVVL